MTIPVSGHPEVLERGGRGCLSETAGIRAVNIVWGGGSDEGANEGEIRFCLAESAVGRGVPQERNDDKAWKPRVPSRQSGCPN